LKKWIYNGLILLFAAVFLVSAGFLASYYISSYQQSRRYEALSSIKPAVTPRPVIPETPQETLPQEPPPAFVEVTDPVTGETVSLLPEFADLYAMNRDIVGWIKIPGTKVDYPVMQTPENPDYYLKRNFDKEYSSRGCIYAREVCNLAAPSDNITLYGHRMKDGTMFGQLDKYMSADFCKENPYIYFDYLTELRTYEVMAVFLTTASENKGFSYHAYVDMTQEEFTEFVSICRELSLYDTKVEAVYGDSFVSLSTCEYSQTNGRLVVVGKRIA